MRIRAYDRSGELLEGQFFSLRVPFDTECELHYSFDATKWIVSDLDTNADGDDAWAQVQVEGECRHDCPSDKTHSSGSKVIAVAWADLLGGNYVNKFVRDCFGESVIVTESFARQLLATELVGLDAMAVPIRENRSGLKNPQLARLVFQGSDCARRMEVRLPEPNECPRCHWGPVVCPACGDITFHCPSCRMELVGSDKQRTECPFSVEPYEETNAIIEGHLWDGSDFIGGGSTDGGFITRRALRYLIGCGATPFIAKLCSVNVKRMTKAEVARLHAL